MSATAGRVWSQPRPASPAALYARSGRAHLDAGHRLRVRVAALPPRVRDALVVAQVVQEALDAEDRRPVELVPEELALARLCTRERQGLRGSQPALRWRWLACRLERSETPPVFSMCRKSTTRFSMPASAGTLPAAGQWRKRSLLSGLGAGLRARLLVSSGLFLRECVALAGARVLLHLEAPGT